MVKQVRIIMDDKDYEILQRLKGNRTWRDFIFDLIDFKRKMEEEGEFLSKDSLKEPYVDVAKLLRRLGALLKTVWKEGNYEHKEKWEYEAAALLPLYIASKELSTDEEKELILVVVMALEELLNRKYPELSGELKWLLQGLRMLAVGHRGAYELSMDNFVDERSRRQGTSAD